MLEAVINPTETGNVPRLGVIVVARRPAPWTDHERKRFVICEIDDPALELDMAAKSELVRSYPYANSQTTSTKILDTAPIDKTITDDFVDFTKPKAVLTKDLATFKESVNGVPADK